MHMEYEKNATTLRTKKVSESTTEQTYCIRYPHLNSLNRLFGGQLLEWIDETGAMAARRHCGRDAITACIDNLHFKCGAYLNDIVVLVAKVTYVGTTSMEVRVDTYVEDAEGARHAINRAYMVMVAIGDDGKPTKVPALITETPSEQMEWENALKRKEYRTKRKQEGF